MSKRFFFVLGLPRSRTAWLSILLTGRDSFCFHEGHGAFSDWPAYVAALRARPEGCVGDSSPGLIEHIDALREEFPTARFAVVRRDPLDSLEAFCAACPKDEEAIRAGWNSYVELFDQAVAKLPAYLPVLFSDLGSLTICDSIHQYLLRTPMDAQRWQKLRGLRIMSTFPPVRQKTPATTRPLEVTVNVEGFDFSGLTVRAYEESDRSMISEWWVYHKEAPMHEIRLPPLGIIVEDEGGPVAALWCYETYGAGVAWVAVPVTRPHTCYERACTVMAFAIMAITQLAGKGYEPAARFTCFRVICPPAMGRLLKRIGFKEQPDRSNFYLSL